VVDFHLFGRQKLGQVLLPGLEQYREVATIYNPYAQRPGSRYQITKTRVEFRRPPGQVQCVYARAGQQRQHLLDGLLVH
jgi:hypothetical protein